MGDNVYPCIIYQRLRPSEPAASRHALDHIWPMADRVLEREGYYNCGLYGDSEYAPPFCGGSEIRPGFEAALDRARAIASKLGVCTVLVGNAAPIGDGDPFLPPLATEDVDRGVRVRLINFQLRSPTRSISLRSAWRYFDRAQQGEKAQASDHLIPVQGNGADIEMLIEVDHPRMRARLYLTNPASLAVSVQWKLLVQRTSPSMRVDLVPWNTLVIPPGRGAYLASLWKAELPWVRQLRVKCSAPGAKLFGAVHFSPADIGRGRLPLVWKDTD